MHRRLAVATLCVTLLLAACTPHAPQPPAPPSSGPKMPSGPPTSATASPSASRKADPAVAAVAKAYAEEFKEFNRLEMVGGATKPSQVLLDTTSGELRKAIMTVLRSDRKHNIREVRPGKLIGVVVAAGSGDTRKLTACEDYTSAKWVHKDGTTVKVDQPILNLQHSTAKRSADGRWRIDYTETTDVKTFKHVACGGGE